MKILATGTKAIEMKVKNPGIKLNKYADPVDGPMENVSVGFAEEVCREDDKLIFATDINEEMPW